MPPAPGNAGSPREPLASLALDGLLAAGSLVLFGVAVYSAVWLDWWTAAAAFVGFSVGGAIVMRRREKALAGVGRDGRPLSTAFGRLLAVTVIGGPVAVLFDVLAWTLPGPSGFSRSAYGEPLRYELTAIFGVVYGLMWVAAGGVAVWTAVRDRREVSP